MLKSWKKKLSNSSRIGLAKTFRTQVRAVTGRHQSDEMLACMHVFTSRKAGYLQPRQIGRFGDMMTSVVRSVRTFWEWRRRK